MVEIAHHALNAEAERASAWLIESALPMWANRGFDHIHSAFHEQLDFSLFPITHIPSRLMVQARQVSVFAAAAISGRYPAGGELALIAAQNMIERYEHADGYPGWIFSLKEASIFSSQRDLYAHAFVLFSLSWVFRLEKRQCFLDAVDRTLSFLDEHMADPVAGGYWDNLPRTDKIRRQNPHMHLFEAFIALYEATGEVTFLERGRRLRDLAVEHFLARDNWALRECFFDHWEVSPLEGKGSVEPGHLFEWAWLLSRYQFLSGESQSDVIEGMMSLAIKSGLDTISGRIIDEIAEDGKPVRTSSRSWPHAEALKALTSNSSVRGGGRDALVALILRRLTTLYCPESLGGGWQDQLDKDDRPVSANIPASTFYHLYFGITSVADALRARQASPKYHE